MSYTNHLRKKNNTSSLNTFPENWRRDKTSQLNYEHRIFLKPKVKKVIQTKENYRRVFLMNIEIKVVADFGKLNSVVCVRDSTLSTGWFTRTTRLVICSKISIIHHINRDYGRKPYDYPSRWRKSIWQKANIYLLQNLSKLGIKRNFLILIKLIYEKY